MNRKQRRRAAKRGSGALSPAAFKREITEVVEGDPTADPSVRAFWRHFARTGDIVAALPTDGGVSVIRDRKEGAR